MEALRKMDPQDLFIKIFLHGGTRMERQVQVPKLVQNVALIQRVFKGNNHRISRLLRIEVPEILNRKRNYQVRVPLRLMKIFKR